MVPSKFGSFPHLLTIIDTAPFAGEFGEKTESSDEVPDEDDDGKFFLELRHVLNGRFAVVATPEQSVAPWKTEMSNFWASVVVTTEVNKMIIRILMTVIIISFIFL